MLLLVKLNKGVRRPEKIYENLARIARRLGLDLYVVWLPSQARERAKIELIDLEAGRILRSVELKKLGLHTLLEQEEILDLLASTLKGEAAKTQP